MIWYLKKRNVDQNLLLKVKKQIAYTYEQDEEYSIEAEGIIKGLTEPLQWDVRRSTTTTTTDFLLLLRC